jgi:Phage capsid family
MLRAMERTPIPLRPDIRMLAFERRCSVHRAVAALVLAGDRSTRSADDILRAAWPSDRMASAMLKAATSPTKLGDFPGQARVLSLQDLAPESAALQLFARGLELDLTGLAKVTVPRVDLPPVAVFVEEGQPAPAYQFVFGGVDVGPVRKMLLLSAVSAELQKATPETASAIIGRVLAAACSKALDAVAFGTGVGDAATPRGLLNGVTPITAAAGGGPGGRIDAMTTDLAAMAKAMADGGVDPSSMVVVAAVRQALALQLIAGSRFAHPVFATLGLADGTVAAFAPAAVASSVDEQPNISTAKEATFHLASPAQPISTPGSPSPTVAAPVRSLYQQDLIAVRVRADAIWALTAPAGAQVINSVTW